MNNAEVEQLLKQAQEIGLSTFGDLMKFKIAQGCKTNNDLLNAVNAVFCTNIK